MFPITWCAGNGTRNSLPVPCAENTTLCVPPTASVARITARITLEIFMSPPPPTFQERRAHALIRMSSRGFNRPSQLHHHPKQKHQASRQHQRPKNSQRIRRANPFSNSASQQRPNRLHAHEHRRVHGHDPPAQFIRHTALNNRIRRRHLHRGGKTHDKKHHH